jgi:hypothetical protein
MLKHIIPFVLCLLLISCNTEKRAIKKLATIKRDFPQLFSEKRDTVIKDRIVKVVVPEYRHDTLVNTEGDTVTIENEKVITRIEYKKDTVVHWRVQTTVKPDTIKVAVRDTIFKIKEAVITNTAYYVPWWVYALCAAAIIFVIYVLVYSYRQK